MPAKSVHPAHCTDQPPLDKGAIDVVRCTDQPPLEKAAIDVVVAEADDTCRAAAALALKKFGFYRIYEAEDAAQALKTVGHLQSTLNCGLQVPIMVFIEAHLPGSGGSDCALQVCALLRQRQLARRPFLVCSSALAWRQQSAQPFFHCAICKTFEPSRLASCFNLCQQWWLRGGSEPQGALSQLAKQGLQVAAPTQETCVDSPRQFPLSPFDDISVIRMVARGSFGRVYQARWHVAPVALKVVGYGKRSKPDVVAFEGALSASLAHPNLVQTFKYSVQADVLDAWEVFIVQEWCNLGTLASNLRENLGNEEVLEVCAEMCSAAAYLHGRGIIHGDLTANNVLLTERSCPKGYISKISDFGLARVLDLGASRIDTATMGTVTHMPPELFQLEGCALTKKVDVYAFGIILWQLCTGRTPFEGLQPAQVVVMVAAGKALALPPTAPEFFQRIFQQSSARLPEYRPDFDRLALEFAELALAPENG